MCHRHRNRRRPRFCGALEWPPRFAMTPLRPPVRAWADGGRSSGNGGIAWPKPRRGHRDSRAIGPSPAGFARPWPACVRRRRLAGKGANRGWWGAIDPRRATAHGMFGASGAIRAGGAGIARGGTARPILRPAVFFCNRSPVAHPDWPMTISKSFLAEAPVRAGRLSSATPRPCPIRLAEVSL